MAIGRITGPMLFGNLDRQGVPLQIDTDLVYFDVSNRRLGINTTSPNYSLDIHGNAHLGNLYILDNTITSDTGKINLGSPGNLLITGGVPNYVLKTDGSGNLDWVSVSTLTGSIIGNSIVLGANTSPSLVSNAVTLTTTTTVTDAIAELNQVLGTITNSTGSILSVTGNVTASNINVTFSGNSTSPTTGALVVAGGVGIAKDLHVGGNVYAGSIVSENIAILSVQDPLLYLTANTPYPYDYDLGFYSHFVGGSVNNYQHTGLVRNYLDNVWYFFSNLPEPEGSTVDLANTRIIYDTVKAGGLLLANTTPSVSVSTGALIVAGGAGIAGNVNAGNISAAQFTGITVGNVYGNVITSSQPYITSVGTLTSLDVSGNITSTLLGNVYTNYISSTIGNVVTFTGTGAIALPVGTAAQEPVAQAGYMRFNSTTSAVEFFNGSSWVSVVNSITNQRVIPDGTSQSYTLDYNAISSGILVSINGVLQQPDVSYTALNNQITFSEIPQDTDIIDIRFISIVLTGYGNTQVANYLSTDPTVVAIQSNIAAFETYANVHFGTSSYSNVNVAAYLVENPQGSIYSNANVSSYLTTYDGNISAGNISADTLIGNLITGGPAVVSSPTISVTTANSVINSFSTSLYRSAVYQISGSTHAATVQVLQNSGTVVLSAYGVLNTDTNNISYYANITGGTVNLIAKSTVSSNIRVQTTYFSI
jgi:hypothetical protein